MFAAHAATAVVIKSRVPEASAAWLLVGAFLVDVVWIACATLGLEPTGGPAFFDDWSHSLLTVLLWATAFAVLFRRKGRAVALAMWVAAASHFLLDLPIHPKALALYPHSSAHLSLGIGKVAPLTYWNVQLVVVAVLAVIYVLSMRRRPVERSRVAGTAVGLFALHIVLMPPV
jgi:hypothetical protein